MKRTIAALVLCVAGAVQAQFVEEVPFITSPDNVTLEMLRLAAVGPGDHVIDLGSGDGRIVILAAKRFGATGLGVEIDPRLVQESRKHAAEAGVADRVEFREQDLFRTDLSTASVITMYLLPEVNLQLRPALLALKPGTRVVSHDWDMGDWKPDASTVVPVPHKQIGLEKSSRVHLWVVPAKVDGLWCGPGGPLELKQAYQEVDARVARDGHISRLQGRMQGMRLQLGAATYVLQGDSLRAAGESFTRARGPECPSRP
jgi:SAM-dependent methyltransferase